MPQIAQLSDLGYLLSQVLWIVLIFGLAYVLVGRGLVPKVTKTMDARDAAIAADLAAAESARIQADATEAQWRAKENAAREAAQKLIAEAKASGARSTEAALAAANGAAEQKIAEAEARIAASRDAAVAEVEGVAADAARDIVARLSGVSVTEEAARSAVKEAIHG
ncbi:ATPase [Sphingomonas sp. FW199]|uniref:F0F1 ATP synthase subunit B family protein n=1 Tax=unclassified Sphingomonas TaxID=196159 RepID=UPI0021A25C29|nr:ATPase [Sphingomonas sp. BGYR3]MDG5489317.1 ATPase [Sphingomonas sp. BGYR3]